MSPPQHSLTEWPCLDGSGLIDIRSVGDARFDCYDGSDEGAVAIRLVHGRVGSITPGENLN